MASVRPDVVPAYLQALEQLPAIDPQTLLRERHLLVVAPHPDDESLGVGGLIAAAAAAGLPVTVAFLTNGEGSHVGSPTCPPDALARIRRDEACKALAELGVRASSIHFLGLGDSRLAALDDTTKTWASQRLRDLAASDVPCLVCVTAATDPHADHQAAYQLVVDTRWEPDTEIMAYPIWTWTLTDATLPAAEPKGVQVDIAEWLPLKRKAIAAHRSQHGEIVTDAVEAFVLDPGFVATFMKETEVLLWPT